MAPRTFATATAPGKAIGVQQGAVRYDCPTLAEVAGKTIDGRRVGHALYVSGEDSPYVDTWETAPRNTAGSRGIVGARVDAQTDGRVDVTLDDGSQMANIPLWASPGVRALVTLGARVLVVDLADDPRGGFALSGPWDAGADELTFTAATSVIISAPVVDLAAALAYVLRSGDVIAILNADGTPLPGPLAPLSSLPLKLSLHATQDDPVPAGPPGAGHSAVRA